MKQASTRSQPRDLADRAEQAPDLPPGEGERFGGYGVMGLPFASGHYLALRAYTASSIGPAYRAAWHRDPGGRWTVYANAPPEVSWARYLGSALTATRTVSIDIDWTGPRSLTVRIPDVLTWELELSADFATRLMSAIGARLPAGAYHSHWLLRLLSAAAGPVLSAGKIRLVGAMPNGQAFGALPRRVWRITQSSADLNGTDLGAPGPLPAQARLGDFMLPQRGIFGADGAAVFTPPSDTDPIGPDIAESRIPPTTGSAFS